MLQLLWPLGLLWEVLQQQQQQLSTLLVLLSLQADASLVLLLRLVA
jgi:hypothetical protein